MFAEVGRRAECFLGVGLLSVGSCLRQDLAKWGLKKREDDHRIVAKALAAKDPVLGRMLPKSAWLQFKDGEQQGRIPSSSRAGSTFGISTRNGAPALRM